jgi:hypothetical protein
MHGDQWSKAVWRSPGAAFSKVEIIVHLERSVILDDDGYMEEDVRLVASRKHLC